MRKSLCQSCLTGIEKHGNSQCPVCRQGFSGGVKKKSVNIERDVRYRSAQCPTCSQQIPLRNFTQHQASCEQQKSGRRQRGRIGWTLPERGLTRPRAQPNRSTFNCPYCAAQNMDNHALIEHVETEHSSNNERVVCPICAAQPWGNPNQVSADFRSHLKTRHQFDYDLFVKYDEDEETTLSRVVEESLFDQ